ncbi:MAG TPA: SRPBCC family protein [Solirubrobacterales bacterium]|nr:SRPBCC family protein [Solirubrobacterales bacterium]
MRTVHVTRSIPAPPEAVFDRLADHANYDRFRPIHGSELLREGDPPPNGVGALRRIKVRPLVFEEEITLYERPSRLDYLIVKLNVPFEHHGGSIRLSAEGEGTHVDWRSTFTVPTPIIGTLEERIWEPVLARGFRRVLEDVERMTAP